MTATYPVQRTACSCGTADTPNVTKLRSTSASSSGRISSFLSYSFTIQFPIISYFLSSPDM